jgi:hypothetical protein
MKQHHWLIIIVASLLGMLLVPKTAYSANFRAVEIISPVAPVITPISSVILPRLPIPTTIPGPAVNLPSPVIPLVSIQDSIKVAKFVAPKQEGKGLFAAAQKSFAAAPGEKAPAQGQLNAGFDNTSKPGAKADAVSAEDDIQPQPRKTQRPQNSRVIQVPTWELENEIGI